MTKQNKLHPAKQVFFLAIRLILKIISLILTYLLVAFILSKFTVAEEANAPDDLDIYILTNGVHVDLVVPTTYKNYNWFETVPHLPGGAHDAEFKYLAIGWGDKGFYLNTPTWAELKASTALKAAFGLGGSAIHATYYKNMVENEVCKKISISEAQYQRLVEYIHAGFSKDVKGQFIPIDTEVSYAGYQDAFYEAKGRYSLFKTCNSWANKGLKASGQRACVWTAFQQGIFSKYQ